LFNVRVVALCSWNTAKRLDRFFDKTCRRNAASVFPFDLRVSFSFPCLR